MALRIIGAGMPRTGTTSLKAAIEQLTGEGCYHMFEVFPRWEQHLPLWHRVLGGDIAATDEIFRDFGSAIDWPASSFWRELSERHPDAIVVLTRRSTPEQWWASANRTVWEAMRRTIGDEQWDAMVEGLRGRFHEPLDDPEGAMAAYEAHNQQVRDTIDLSRLIEMEPSDGWGPICEALGVVVPDEPYPHENTTDEFRKQTGWD